MKLLRMVNWWHTQSTSLRGLVSEWSLLCAVDMKRAGWTAPRRAAATLNLAKDIMLACEMNRL